MKPRLNLAKQVRVLGAESLLPPERPRRKRKNTAVEKILQTEVTLRLKAYPVICVPIPNAQFLPARSAAEKEMARRLIGQAKKAGMLSPGAGDLVVMGSPRGVCVGGFIELKRPAERTLLGKIPGGVLSDRQKDFRARCADVGVNWAVCTSWPEVETALTSWGVIA